MRTRKLGARGPEISVVGYGAWEIGGEAYGPNQDEGDVVSAVHAALDAGVSWIDTAEVYGKGTSETMVGRAIRGRHDVLVATKVAPRPVGTGFEPAQVRRALRASMRRLGVDHVGLYQLHWWTDDVPVEETWGAMAELQEEGLVGHIGVSNFSVEQMERCLGGRHVDSLQPQLSMLHRHGETLSPWCAEHGIGVIVYGPLAYGLLTGAVEAGTRFAPDDWRSGSQPDHPYYKDLFAPGRIERNLEVVERLRPVAARLGVTLGQLALAWAVARPGITAAIAGSRSPAHNRENAGAGEIELDAGVTAEIDVLLSA